MSGFKSTSLRDGYRLRVQASNKDLTSLTETQAWEESINALGGSINSTERGYADNVITAIAASSFNSKIIYLLPFIGGSIAAHRVPLRDSLGVGPADNLGFVDADCSTSAGLSNPTEAAKRLDTKVYASQLGVSANGGLGFWERNWGAGNGVEPIGSYDSAGIPDRRFVIDLRSTLQNFRWGAPGNPAGSSTTAINAHYYGQRSSATLRRMYRDGVHLGADSTTSDTASGGNERPITVMGNAMNPTAPYWKGRCAVAYMTDGTLTDAEVLDLHNLLNTHLVVATGR